MTVREALVAGVPARVFRISFSGELAYEINVPTWYGHGLWEAVMAAGESFGITHYGTEAMQVLRAEKGYGEVAWDTEITNQNGEVVAGYDVLTMVSEQPVS